MRVHRELVGHRCRPKLQVTFETMLVFAVRGLLARRTAEKMRFLIAGILNGLKSPISGAMTPGCSAPLRSGFCDNKSLQLHVGRPESNHVGARAPRAQRARGAPMLRARHERFPIPASRGNLYLVISQRYVSVISPLSH